MKKTSMNGKWMADFETCAWLKDETYVWLWAVCNIETEETEWGTDIESFISWCQCMGRIDVYFHNLKFDGEFIIHYLLNNGFEHVERTKKKRDFSTLISSDGQFFSIDVRWEDDKEKRVKFYDSFKIIPLKAEEIPDAFGLDIYKKDLVYGKPRPLGYIPNKSEIEYILNDVKIPARALKLMFEQGLTKMTQASNALSDFKGIIGFNTFEHFFPKLPLEIDGDIRRAYRGGFTYLSPEYASKTVYDGIVIDVNSLYPSVMVGFPLPISTPKFFEGKYQEDKWYNLYIQHIRCQFELKENKIPTIQIKGDARFRATEYLRDSGKKPVSLTLTNIDLEDFFNNYDVSELEYLNGWKFRSAKGIFDKYVDKWYNLKSEADANDNKGLYKISKLMLNALYGKFGLNPLVSSKIPYLDDGVVKYTNTKPKERKPIYIPMAVFITSYARHKTISTAQKIYDYSLDKYGVNKYIYSDTDSIHTILSREELEAICDIDDERLGAWGLENTFSKGRFIRAKSYIEETPKGRKICCAGLPSRCYNQITFENFRKGLKVTGKLTFKHVKGGVNLVPTTFVLSEKSRFDMFLSSR